MSLNTETNITLKHKKGTTTQRTFKNGAKALFLICGSNNTGAYIWRYF